MHYYPTNFTKLSTKNTNFTKPTDKNTTWDVFNTRHHYGTEFGKTTRVVYGDHVLFGVSFINYKFKNTNYST